MPSNYAQFNSRSHQAVIRVYGDDCNVIETYEHKGDSKEWSTRSCSPDGVIRVYDAAGNVIEKQEHKGDFKEW